LAALGQSPPSFEAASVRRNVNGGSNTQIHVDGGRLTMTNASTKTLIRNAYEILSFQLAGEPRWLDSEMYDIAATNGGEKISPEGFRLLLRSLLAERFQLKVHWETRETSVYALVSGKDGPKLVPAAGEERPGIDTHKDAGGKQMKGTHESIAVLASNLGNQLGRIVVDKTGLPGRYDWMLVWDPDPTAQSTRPSLFTALQEQLGLKLEAQKGPMQVLVIDSVQRPSEN
jgi:uncharacterized protein (TIGR03435 family)